MIRFGAGRALAVYDLATIEYATALCLQHRLLHARRQRRIGDTLLMLEHPPDVTLGKSAADADILADRATLAAAGATVERVERGGEVTYHGPGQLVGYLIMDLGAHLRSLKTYVHLLEEVFVRVLAERFGIDAGRDRAHRGVWVADQKIAAIGVAVGRRITYHGFAFNVAPNLDHFAWIVACGIRDRGQTSIERLTGTRPDMAGVKRSVAGKLAELFDFAWDGVLRGAIEVDEVPAATVDT